MSEIRFSAEPLESLKQSIDKIFEIAKKYKGDVSEEIATMSVFDFYIFLRDGLAYRKDPSGVEMIARPKYILDPRWSGNRDCDDKTVAACAFFERNKIRYAIDVIAKSESDNVWHVFPVVDLQYCFGDEESIPGNFTAYDATYPGRSQFGKLLFVPKIRRRYYPS